MQNLAKFSITLAATLGISASVLTPLAAKAADTVTLMTGPVWRSFTLSSLKELAETGVAGGFMGEVLNFTGESAETAQSFLNQEVEYSLIAADQLLYSEAGESLLEEVGEIIAPRNANTDGKQAMRAAILASLADDNTLTPLEIVENYPVPARINVEELLAKAEQFTSIDLLISFFESSEAVSVSREVESWWQMSERRTRVLLPPVRQTTSTSTTTTPAPVRALW